VYDSAKKVAVVAIMYFKLRSSRTNVLNPFKNNVYGPLNKTMTQEKMELKSGYVIATDRTTSNTRSCYIMLTPVVPERTVFRFELMVKSVGKQWRLCYSEVKEIRSMGCGDDDLRDFLLLV
jgi:hypothetical protein